jgi:hypothetical protein
MVPASAAPALTELGDLSSLRRVAEDALRVVLAGDLTAAQLRITDFETAWDAAAATMQPLSPPKWAAIDQTADAAIAALRAPQPVGADAQATLSALIAMLDNPSGDTTSPASTDLAQAFQVTNADGSPLPCEVALKTLRDAADGKVPTDQAKYDALMNKGLERCNADDDKRADGFFSDAFALL